MAIETLLFEFVSTHYHTGPKALHGINGSLMKYAFILRRDVLFIYTQFSCIKVTHLKKTKV